MSLADLKFNPRTEKESLQAGGYVVRIIGAREENDKFVLGIEIEEGPHAGYYGRRYKRDRANDPSARWKGSYSVFEKDRNDPTAASRSLNALIGAIEHSNDGFKFAEHVNDLQSFKGLVFGLLYREDNFNGFTFAKPFAAVSADRVRRGDYTIPGQETKEKKEEKKTEPDPAPAPAPVSVPGFTELPKSDVNGNNLDDDLPF